MFKRLRKAWQLAKADEQDLLIFDAKKLTPEMLKALSEMGKEQGKVKQRGSASDGGFLGGFMTEEEVAKDVKENELGWKQLYDQVRALGRSKSE